MAEVVGDEVQEGVSVGLTARDKGDGRWEPEEEPEGGYRNPGHPPGTKDAKPLLCIGN